MLCASGSLSRARAVEAMRSMDEASPRNCSPARVRATLLRVRVKSAVPSSSSNARIWWLTAGCVRATLWAALEKFRCSATARKHSSCIVFIDDLPSFVSKELKIK